MFDKTGTKTLTVQGRYFYCEVGRDEFGQFWGLAKFKGQVVASTLTHDTPAEAWAELVGKLEQLSWLR